MTFAIVQGVGVTELLIVLGIVLLILGPKRLPGLGRQLGSGIREFRDGIARRHGDDDAPADEPGALPAGEREAEVRAAPAAGGTAAEPATGEVVGDGDR